jgi:hypothetical protein
VKRLNVSLSQLGCHPATQTEDFFTYTPSFQAGMAAERMANSCRKGRPSLSVRRCTSGRYSNDWQMIESPGAARMSARRR